MPSPSIAPPTNWACILRVMSFTLHHRGLYLSLEGQPSCLSDSWGLETRRRQRAKAAETGSPATLMCWENSARAMLRDRKGANEKERKKGEGREREREGGRERLGARRKRENHRIQIVGERCPWARLALSCRGPPPSARDRDDTATLHQPYVVFIAAGPSNTICDLHPGRGILEFNNGRLCREWARWDPGEQLPRLLFLFLYIV